MWIKIFFFEPFLVEPVSGKMADIAADFNSSCLLSVNFGASFDMKIDLLSLLVYYAYKSTGRS